MKIRVVSSKNEIGTVGKKEEFIHLTFRPSNKDIFLLVQRCKNIKAIHIPTSYKKTISNSTLMFLEMQNITLMEGDVWGHRKDINEYYEIKSKVFERINELKDAGHSKDQIISQLCKETQLSEDLIAFLI